MCKEYALQDKQNRILQKNLKNREKMRNTVVHPQTNEAQPTANRPALCTAVSSTVPGIYNL